MTQQVGPVPGQGQGRGDEPRRIGVYICHCGGNISDYVDVPRLREAVAGEAEVVVAETKLFACADGTQQEMATAIRERHLDGLVVASCSPKLHQVTFRGVAKRAGLNPYTYTQVNVREQCSWAHTDDPAGATEKAIGLVRAGIAQSRLSAPLQPLVVQTLPRTMVVGGGVAGLRAAIGLADIGLEVIVVEREPRVGGWLSGLGPMFPNDRSGREQIDTLLAEIARRPAITVLTGAELVGKSGTFGHYTAQVRVNGRPEPHAATPARRPAADGLLEFEVGTFVVATGTGVYQPRAGEYGYGLSGVLTLTEFTALVDGAAGRLTYQDRPVRSVAYIYCVGNRQPGGNEYCSKFCCAATVHASIKVARLDPAVRQYHLHRGVRTYGRFELMYTESRDRGSVYLRFPDEQPPEVGTLPDGRLGVTVLDPATADTPLTIPADLVVLVTGMVPRPNEELTGLLKLPVGADGYYNEIHPKLRPVETVVDGVLIAGACQGPKTAAESVAAGLAAVTQSGGILKKGYAELDPLVATVREAACTGCAACLTSCPYGAIGLTGVEEGAPGRPVAVVSAATCKGCGGCVPICPEGALDLLGHTDAQTLAAIDGLLAEAVS
jgi:heterodisulfide reductase subunit A2